ncbi:probable glutathione peroxidase 8 isoform X2 [Sipha flava]|nr:probable glutathione peroxidase 8 isoform X2 [Sipha flava]
MKKSTIFCVLTLATLLAPCQSGVWYDNPFGAGPPNIYDFVGKKISGKNVVMDVYIGKLLIFVNIPPLECPYVSSFLDELNQMQIYYYDRGLRVLAFQSFEFGCDGNSYRLPSDKMVKRKKYKFEIFKPVYVNGLSGDRLWSYFRMVTGNNFFSYDIIWNYTKFVVNRNGVVVERLEPEVTAKELEKIMLKYL